MRALPWVGRSLVFAASAVLLVAAGACGDDDGGGPVDAGIDQTIFNPPPPPERDASEQPEGIDTTGRLGTAQLVADVGTSADGPSWSLAEGVLYFTTPSSTPSLHKLSPDGGVSTVGDDGGTSDAGPAIGTASAGTPSFFVSDRSGVTLTVAGDGGAPTSTRYTGAFTQLGDIVAEAREADASARAFVADLGASRAYRFVPTNGGLGTTYTEVFDIRRVQNGSSSGSSGSAAVSYSVTAVAIGKRGSSSVRYVGASTDATGAVFVVDPNASGAGPVTEGYQLPATPPNGIAVDETGYLYVAWARGIDVYPPNGGTKLGSTPGLHLKAAPTSIAFGGADRRTLYVTTATGKIYAIPTSATGILR